MHPPIGGRSCPAEKSANAQKSQRISAKKDAEEIDTKRKSKKFSAFGDQPCGRDARLRRMPTELPSTGSVESWSRRQIGRTPETSGQAISSCVSCLACGRHFDARASTTSQSSCLDELRQFWDLMTKKRERGAARYRAGDEAWAGRSSGALAQLDRALVSGTRGHRFESCMSHHKQWGESDELTLAPFFFKNAIAKLCNGGPVCPAYRRGLSAGRREASTCDRLVLTEIRNGLGWSGEVRR